MIAAKTALHLEDLGGTMSAIYDELTTVAKQLTRIADALQRPARPDLREMTKRSLDDGMDAYRQAVTPLPPEIATGQRVFLESLEDDLAQAERDNARAELHDCTQEKEPLFECSDCPDVETCIHMR